MFVNKVVNTVGEWTSWPPVASCLQKGQDLQGKPRTAPVSPLPLPRPGAFPAEHTVIRLEEQFPLLRPLLVAPAHLPFSLPPPLGLQ